MAITALQTVTLTGQDAVILFENIPNTFKDLKIIGKGTGTANYASTYLRPNNTPITTYKVITRGGSGVQGYAGSSNFCSIRETSDYVNGTLVTFEVDIIGYTKSNHKGILSSSSIENYSTERNINVVQTDTTFSSLAFYWSSGNWNSGTTISLFGVDG